MIAARITDPPVGASTCASGSHVCTGHIGTFTAKASRKRGRSGFAVQRQRHLLEIQMVKLPPDLYR